MKNKSIAIVGATGAVGREFVGCIESRGVPVKSLKLLASARSAGQKQAFRGQDLTIEELKDDSFNGVDIALFSAGSGISRQYAPIAVKAGAVVVDNSSAFRADPAIPLVVPEHTTLARLLRDFASGGTTFEGQEPDAVVAAILRVVGDFEAQAAGAEAAAARWTDTMGADRMVEAMLARVAAATMEQRAPLRLAA